MCVFWSMVRIDDEENDEAHTHCSDLIPTNPYPRQMMQGIFALDNLLACGYRPSDVCRLQVKLHLSKT